LSLNVSNYQPPLRNILEERRSQSGLPGFVCKPSLYCAADTLQFVGFISYIFSLVKLCITTQRNIFSSCNLLSKKQLKCYIRSIALYCAETRTLRAVDQKHLESFEMWCCRRMEKISWTDHVKTEEVLLRVKEQRNILHEISKRKANWIGHILRRNCLLQ